MSDPTTFLFVPGDRPERFDKAVAAGADLVVLDLEDAVPAGAKDAARGHVVDWLAKGGPAAVRINTGELGAADAEA
ncbi:CoA ester lyase, partial [Xanthomonas citri pv. citri]|nr:CoA ester lyase [Xanthomonas citri pv. citri]